MLVNRLGTIFAPSSLFGEFAQKAHAMKIIAAGLLILSLCSAGMAVTTTLASARTAALKAGR
jgi:hypothetical protein